MVNVNNKVGILLPFYKNKPKWTRTLLDSIEKQTYKDWVIYAVDDGSNDKNKTWNEIKHLKNTVKLPVNIGAHEAWNVCGYMAKGDNCQYVCTPSQDDILKPNYLREMVSQIKKGYDFVVCAGEIFGSNQGILNPDPKATYESAWKCNPFTSFALFKMSIWKAYQGYDTSITPDHIKTGIADCELWLRLLRDKRRFSVIGKILYRYRVHGKNASMIFAKPHIKELYDIIKKKHNYKK